MRLISLVWTLIALAALATAWDARATATVRVEWTRGGVVYGAQTLSATGTSVATSASPTCAGQGCTARVTALAGAAIVTWGSAPVSTQTNGLRLDVGQTPMAPVVNPGDKVAIIEASDAAAVGAVTCASGCASLAAVAPVASTAAESCHVFKASAGTLYSIGGYAGQAEWIMVFNLTAPPGDGAVTPAAWGYAGAAGFWSLAYTTPASLTTGITACYSSTGPLTKTAISTNNVFSGQFQ